MFMEKKKKLVHVTSLKHQRAGDGTRTRDSLLGRQELYQLSYSRSNRGARTRTADLLVPNQARYQLRHTPSMHLNYNMLLAACQVPFWKFAFVQTKLWLVAATIAQFEHKQVPLRFYTIK
jgi:hypothetical protein